MSNFQTRPVSFQLQYLVSKPMPQVSKYGHKFCVTMVDTEGKRYRLLNYTPEVKIHGVDVMVGDTVEGLATVRHRDDTGELLTLLYNSLRVYWNDEIKDYKDEETLPEYWNE